MRTATLLVAFVVAGLAVLGPRPAGAQTVQMVAAVAKYVGLTAALAEALNGLAGAVAETYATGRTITDDLGCRRQKAALQDLVIALRDLEVEKSDLHTRLSRAVYYMSDWRDWGQVRIRAERVRVAIVALEQQIQDNREAFAGNTAVSRAYSNVLIGFDAKQNLVRDLVAEMQGVTWEQTRLRQNELEPHFDALERLEQDLDVQNEAIGEATDDIADYADALCKRPAG